MRRGSWKRCFAGLQQSGLDMAGRRSCTDMDEIHVTGRGNSVGV
jgi:hypothetical protein